MPTTYQIRPSDTLSALAARYKLSVQEIAEANGIRNANAIKAGDTLVIPTKDEPGAPAAAPAPERDRVTLTRTTYTIKRGDTLEQIADRHGASVRELMDLNGLRNPNAIQAGATLRIPVRHTTEPVAPDAAPVPRPRPRPEGFQRPARPMGTDTVALSTAPGLSARDTEALIRAVAAEARGESPEVWAGVAQTIINYSRQNDQPIHRLVRTSYLSSNFDGNRRYYTMPLSRIPNLDGIRAAVNLAAQGGSPIGDRIHFHDDSIRTPWFGDRSTRFKIGPMVFFNPK